MVEILEKGNMKKYKIKCCHCNSVLKFTSLDEVSEYNPDVPFEGQATDWSIKCPNCNKNVPTRSITDKGRYDWREEIDNEDKFEIKIPSSTVCPNCGEHYSYYVSKEGKQKGILVGEYVYESFFDPHHGHHYDCYTCGHKWSVRESEESLSVKLFPFLRNK